MAQEGAKNLAAVPVDPLGDIMVAYHFVSALLGFYSTLMRDCSGINTSQKAQLEKHSEEILADIGVLYDVWDVERKNSNSNTPAIDGAKVKLRTASLYTFSRHTWLERILSKLNAWTETKHWLSLALVFNQRWARVVKRLKQAYPQQTDAFTSLEKRATVRAADAILFLMTFKANVRNMNQNYEIPKELTAD